MNTIPINTSIESYNEMPTEKRSALLQYILIHELYFDEPIKDWLRNALKSERDDALRPMMIEALAVHTDETGIRDALEDILKRLPEDSMTYNAVKEILITALTDDTDEVRTWGSRLIRTCEKINPANRRKFSEYLFRHLKDETLPPRLRWHAALGLSHLGTGPAIRHLIMFGRELTQNISRDTIDSGSKSENSSELSDFGRNDRRGYNNDIRIFLAEKVAYSLGAAHEKVSLHRKKKEALELLGDMREQIGYDDDGPDPVLWAIEKIQQHPSPPDPPWLRFLREIQEAISPKLVSAMATACFLLALVSAGRIYTPIFPDISVIKAPYRTRGHIPSRPSEVNRGGVLRSGEFFRIKVRVNRDAYVRVLLYDSAGKISELLSDRIRGGRTLSIPPEEKRFRLNWQTGTETLFVLASKESLERFDERFEELKAEGIDEISRVFPEAEIRSFSFEHQ